MKLLLKILVFILSAQSAIGQIYLKPNNSYGIISNRNRPDSTQWIPTGCGTPSGIASLRSSNQFMGAIYADTCNKRFFLFNPTDTTWIGIYPIQISDSSFKFGRDTIVLRGGGGGAGTVKGASEGLTIEDDTAKLGVPYAESSTASQIRSPRKILFGPSGNLYLLKPSLPNLVSVLQPGYFAMAGDNAGGQEGRFLIDDATGSTLALRNKGTNSEITHGSARIGLTNGGQTQIGSGTGMDGSAKLTVDGKIQVKDGSQGVGKTIVSDANGLGGWDSLNYDAIRNKPTLDKGVYFSPAEELNPGFIVFASTITRPKNSFSGGQPIIWEFLDHVTQHNSSFFDSAYGAANQRLTVRYPNVKNVINVTITPDETFAANCAIAGPTVGTTTFEAQVVRPKPVGIRISGNGTSTLVKNGFNTGMFTLTTYGTYTGGFGVQFAPTYAKDENLISFKYDGPNNYRIKRQYGGLGANDVVVILVDEFGNPVTDFPTASDNIFIDNAGMTSLNIPMNIWGVDNAFMGSFTNFWVFGVFETWMVASAVTNSSIQVRWQTNYPSATNYKIYRSSTGINGSFTLIHTGTSGTYVDTGLTTGTIYTYKMVAVVSGVDTPVTTFNANTDL